MISFEEFKKLQIKVAKVKEVKAHPQADKLYILVIDLGDKEKQIVAGIKNFYSPEDLIGRSIVVIDNLAPTLIRGVESQAMLLAVQDSKGISIITPDRDVPAGSLIK
ncbi:MAG: methionine--tRNA ligase subunit beta [Candidatus Omnitrophica bacterium]|nr:methionine--tRNA ligase subunit beta [Candidatus Omnitrophota bacterium]